MSNRAKRPAPKSAAAKPVVVRTVEVSTADARAALRGAFAILEAGQVELPAALALRKLIRALRPIIEDADAQTRALTEKYGRRKDDKLEMNDDGSVPLAVEHRWAYHDERRAIDGFVHSIEAPLVPLSLFKGKVPSTLGLVQIGEFLDDDEAATGPALTPAEP